MRGWTAGKVECWVRADGKWRGCGTGLVALQNVVGAWQRRRVTVFGGRVEDSGGQGGEGKVARGEDRLVTDEMARLRTVWV